MFREWLNRLAGRVVVFFWFASILYFWVFGVIWTYYRYGQEKGTFALMFPPAAWYHAALMPFEPPQWEEEWDIHVEALAYMSFMEESQLSSQQLTVLAKIRKWAAEVPPERKESLETRFRVFARLAVEGTMDSVAKGRIVFADSPQELQGETGLLRALKKCRADAVSVMDSISEEQRKSASWNVPDSADRAMFVDFLFRSATDRVHRILFD